MKRLPVTRDQEVEHLYGVDVESVSAFYDEESGNLMVVGELAANNGVPSTEYREVQVVVHDVEGATIGCDSANWMNFGLRQSFELSLDTLHGTPATVRVFPTSSFPDTLSVHDITDTRAERCHEVEASFPLGPATWGREQLASMAEIYSSQEGIEACTQVSISFFSDDPAALAGLLAVEPSWLTQRSPAQLELTANQRLDVDLAGQIAALLSLATDDLDAWRVLAQEHLAGVSVTITTSGYDSVHLSSDIMAAMVERGLSVSGFIVCE